MEANIKSFSPVKIITSTEALELLYAGIDSAEVKEKLSKWFSFGLKDKSIRLSALTTGQLALFMDKLPDLVLILYNRQKELQKGGDK